MLGGPPTRSGFPPPSGRVTPPRYGLVLLRRSQLLEAFEMRSNTEHLHVLSDKHEDVCWKRTRQIEHLACDAYSRLLRDPALRKRFQTEAEIEAFWKLSDGQRRGLYGTPLDIAQEPLVQE